MPCSSSKLFPPLGCQRPRKGSHRGRVAWCPGWKTRKRESVPTAPDRIARSGGEGSPAWARPTARVRLVRRPPATTPAEPTRAAGSRPATPEGEDAASAPPRTGDGAARFGRARAREPGDSAAVLRGEGARRASSRPLPRPGWPSGLPAGVGFPPAACRDAARHPAARSPPYPDTAPLELARPGDASSSSPGRSPPLPPPPPSAGFQIEIPWLGPSENSPRKLRPLLAEAPPRIPRPARPGRGNPRGQATPHRQGHAPGAGWRGRGAFPRGSRGSRAQCPAAGLRFALGVTLEIMTTSARVRGVLSENPGLKCPLNF